MTDQSAETPSLEFTPVPRRCARHDGWTPARQRGFIDALADLGSVRAAANAQNMTPESAYYLRRQPEAESFRAAWEAALALGVQRLEDVAMERALHGVEVPVYSYGKLVGTRRVHNDRLLMFLLRNRAAHRFNVENLSLNSPAIRGQLASLKQQWHAEWLAEQRVEAENVLESLNAKLEVMRQRSLAARAEAAAAAEDEDDEEEPCEPRVWRQPDPAPTPPRIAPLGSSLATEWLVHLEEGRIGPRIRRIEE